VVAVVAGAREAILNTLNKHLVVFTPSGKRGHFPEGTSLLDAGRSLGVDIDSVCGGRGICGRCQINVVEGDFAKHAVKSRKSLRLRKSSFGPTPTPMITMLKCAMFPNFWAMAIK